MTATSDFRPRVVRSSPAMPAARPLSPVEVVPSFPVPSVRVPSSATCSHLTSALQRSWSMKCHTSVDNTIDVAGSLAPVPGRSLLRALGPCGGVQLADAACWGGFDAGSSAGTAGQNRLAPSVLMARQRSEDLKAAVKMTERIGARYWCPCDSNSPSSPVLGSSPGSTSAGTAIKGGRHLWFEPDRVAGATAGARRS